MRIDLGSMAVRAGYNREFLTLRPNYPTRAIQGELEQGMLQMLRDAQDRVKSVLLPAYVLPSTTMDYASGGLSEALARVSEALREGARRAAAAISRWADRVEQWHRQKFVANIKASAKVDVSVFLSVSEVQDQIQAALDWASSLIQGLSDDVRKEISSLVWAAYSARTPREELAKQLNERFGVGQSRSEFIARDQTAKLASSLEQARQTQTGFGDYIWRHSGKTHFRPEHKAREGKVYSWSDAPAGGHPGTEPNCGCTAQAYMRLR